jgi:O-antigen/teichoic acid export membrane protein
MLETVKLRFRRLLYRSNAVTGTDNIYVAQQGFWASLPYIVGSFLSAGLVIAFANLLPKDTYGNYRYILSVAGILSFLTLSGMNSALTQAVARGVKGLLAWSIGVQLKFNSLYAFTCFVGAVYYWFHGNHVLALGLLIMGIVFPFNTALTSYGAYLAGKKDFRTASRYAVSSSIFFTALVFGTLLLTDSVIILVTAYAVGVLAPSVYFYFVTERRDAGHTAEASEKNAVLRYSAHLSIVPVIAVIAQYLDKIILFQTIGSVEVAIYALAQAMPERVKGLAKSASSIILPKLSERSLVHIRPIFYRRLAFGALIGTLGFIGYWFIAPILFRVLLPGYLASLDYSRVLMSSLILAIPFNYIGAVFRSQKMLRAIYLSSFVARTPAVILYFVFGITGGIWGMVWANVVGITITVFGSIIIWEIESRRLAALANRKDDEIPPDTFVEGIALQ